MIAASGKLLHLEAVCVIDRRKGCQNICVADLKVNGSCVQSCSLIKSLFLNQCRRPDELSYRDYRRPGRETVGAINRYPIDWWCQRITCQFDRMPFPA